VELCKGASILANLFLHYAFDLWMKRTHPDLTRCRYADDGRVHCRTKQEAEALQAELQARLAECQLQMQPTKTRIVSCKDDERKGSYRIVKFDFLGYEFRPRAAWGTQGKRVFCGFPPVRKALSIPKAVVFNHGLRRRLNFADLRATFKAKRLIEAIPR
jgi:hypothetical protein